MYWHNCVHPQNLNREMLEDRLSAKIKHFENIPLYGILMSMWSLHTVYITCIYMYVHELDACTLRFIMQTSL